MDDTSGFYRLETQGWVYGGHGLVYGPGYLLSLETKNDYTYPIDGWDWYDEKPGEIINT